MVGIELEAKATANWIKAIVDRLFMHPKPLYDSQFFPSKFLVD